MVIFTIITTLSVINAHSKHSRKIVYFLNRMVAFVNYDTHCDPVTIWTRQYLGIDISRKVFKTNMLISSNIAAISKIFLRRRW